MRLIKHLKSSNTHFPDIIHTVVRRLFFSAWTVSKRRRSSSSTRINIESSINAQFLNSPCNYRLYEEIIIGRRKIARMKQLTCWCKHPFFSRFFLVLTSNDLSTWPFSPSNKSKYSIPTLENVNCHTLPLSNKSTAWMFSFFFLLLLLLLLCSSILFFVILALTIVLRFLFVCLLFRWCSLSLSCSF